MLHDSFISQKDKLSVTYNKSFIYRKEELTKEERLCWFQTKFQWNQRIFYPAFYKKKWECMLRILKSFKELIYRFLIFFPIDAVLSIHVLT